MQIKLNNNSTIMNYSLPPKYFQILIFFSFLTKSYINQLGQQGKTQAKHTKRTVKVKLMIWNQINWSNVCLATKYDQKILAEYMKQEE